MLLAAGRGERLRPLTDTLPKALVEVNGESLLERHLRALSRDGIQTVIINLGWLGEQIAARVGSGADYGLQVIYSPEGDDILETGGGIHKALPMLGDEPFLVVNADIYTDIRFDLPPLVDDVLGHLVLVETPAHKPVGDFDCDKGKVRNGPEPAYTFSGVARYRRELFDGCKSGRFPLAPLLRRAADAGQLSASLHSGEWTDVGTAARLAQLQSD